jgi:hypothetical protein
LPDSRATCASCAPRRKPLVFQRGEDAAIAENCPVVTCFGPLEIVDTALGLELTIDGVRVLKESIDEKGRSGVVSCGQNCALLARLIDNAHRHNREEAGIFPAPGSIRLATSAFYRRMRGARVRFCRIQKLNGASLAEAISPISKVCLTKANNFSARSFRAAGIRRIQMCFVQGSERHLKCRRSLY